MTGDDRIRVVLWDIDHTLVESGGVGREIYQRVFPQVTGKPLRELAAVHGRTELEIIRNTLQLHDLEPTDQAVEDLASALADGYRAAQNELRERGRVLPGALEALQTLADTAGVHQSVLTGNTTEIARIKLDTFGLTPYLNISIGAYGDDHPDRAQLVHFARSRAADHLGDVIPADQVILIGDTPSDVEAAITAGAHIIAVATGKFTVPDLQAAGATTVVSSLAGITSLSMF